MIPFGTIEKICLIKLAHFLTPSGALIKKSVLGGGVALGGLYEGGAFSRGGS